MSNNVIAALSIPITLLLVSGVVYLAFLLIWRTAWNWLVAKFPANQGDKETLQSFWSEEIRILNASGLKIYVDILIMPDEIRFQKRSILGIKNTIQSISIPFREIQIKGNTLIMQQQEVSIRIPASGSARDSVFKAINSAFSSAPNL